jgi:hypothetical protein
MFFSWSKLIMETRFRITDAGNALYNPFVEHNLMDAFKTEIAHGVKYVFPQAPVRSVRYSVSNILSANQFSKYHPLQTEFYSLRLQGLMKANLY